MNEPNTTQSQHAFSLMCGTQINIRATPGRLWSILTNAKEFSRWNSMVTSLEGEIREGERLKLRVPGTDRVFTPLVTGVVTNERMFWTGGVAPLFKGTRSFRLSPCSDGTTDFAMEERFFGLMLPFVKGSFPDFAPVFSQWASDLKREAERPPSRPPQAGQASPAT